MSEYTLLRQYYVMYFKQEQSQRVRNVPLQIEPASSENLNLSNINIS